MKIIAITSIDDWMKKAQGELKGFYPKKTIKISELVYPVQVQVDETEGTFEIYVPEKFKPVFELNKKDTFGKVVKSFVKAIIILAVVCLVAFLIGDNV